MSYHPESRPTRPILLLIVTACDSDSSNQLLFVRFRPGLHCPHVLKGTFSCFANKQMAISSNQNHHTKSHTIPMRSYLTEAICFLTFSYSLGFLNVVDFCRLTR